ncbi:signal peptidase I [Lujinxingia vulgaris]|uniref:Signal peptidase I n=1 Tax=Lujinxingia vulgaris TaxID=2600176 RepID=A0A5C6XJP6_9DELT|nr:signal peptidase I [Lujinxingia vulgaris]TXD37839.1 signal peptidase I [Lujinxingia vulgaris]
MSRQNDKAQIIDDAQELVRETQLRLDRARKLPDEARYRLQEELNALRQGMKREDLEYVEEVSETVRALAEEHLAGISVKPAWQEYVETVGLAILCALVLRAFFFEAFKIPSGSMEPTLLRGDHLFVNKIRYGIRVPFTTTFLMRFAEPQRGEVVVFRFPSEEAREHVRKRREEAAAKGEKAVECILNFDEKDFIKRIVGLPGDVVEGRGAQLLVNGEPVDRTPIRRGPAPDRSGRTAYYYLETLGEATHQIREDSPPGYDEGHDFGPITVEDGHFFAMGDNRDNSADSRCWGQVPMDNIKGRAMIIWLSLEDGQTGDPGIRWDRFGMAIE